MKTRKTNGISKKALALLLALAVVLLCLPLTGCKQQSGPLRVLIDVAGGSTRDDGFCEEAAQSFIREVQRLGGPEDIELEYVPKEGSERSGVLTRVRTEIMAGGGPDVFIVAQATDYNERLALRESASLFHIPEKSMRQGLFLPLDKYLAEASFMKWEDLNPTVMAAGRTEDGQMVLPLSYDFFTTFYRKEDVTAATDATATWQDMMASEDPALEAATGVPSTLSTGFCSATFSSLADYDSKTLTFTQDDLSARVNEILSQEEKHAAGWDAQTPPYFQRDMCVGVEQYNREPLGSDSAASQDDYIPDLVAAGAHRTEVPLTMVPLYSDQGGVTASIHSFAAVNAQTRRAKDAFFVLDVLLSGEVMRTFNIYAPLVDFLALPVNDTLMQEETPMARTYDWCMTEENFAELCRIRDQITQVRFYGMLDVEIDQCFGKVWAIREGHQEGDPDAIVETTYGRMKQELSE